MLKLKWVDIEREKVDNLLIPGLEDREMFDDPGIASLIDRARKMKEFKGETGDEMVLYHPEGVRAERAILFGCGKYEKFTRETLRAFAGKGVKKCIRLEVSGASIAVPLPEKIDRQMEDILEPLMEGAYLGNYLFDRYKQEKKQHLLKSVEFITSAETGKKYRNLPSKVETVCRGTIMAREWISMPSNEKKPEAFAKSIIFDSKQVGLKTRLLDEPLLKQKGFGAMLAVSAGSRSAAQLVVLEHHGGRNKKQ